MFGKGVVKKKPTELELMKKNSWREGMIHNEKSDKVIGLHNFPRFTQETTHTLKDQVIGSSVIQGGSGSTGILTQVWVVGHLATRSPNSRVL